MRRTPLLTPVVTSLLILALAGCDALQSGKDDNLAFEFVTTDRLPVSFNTPLAAGLSVEVAVYVANTTRAPAVLTLARSNNQDVARVITTVHNRLVLQGRISGTSLIEAFTAPGNDSFDLQVADLASVTLTYPGPLLSPATPPVRVLQGGTARFPMTLRDASDRLLIGYGPIPVTFAPTTAASAVPTASTGHFAAQFDALGVVTLTPRATSPLEVTVVALDAIDALELTIAGDVDRISAGDNAIAVADARDDLNQSVYGLTGVISVTTTTADVCTVTQSHLLGDAAYEILGLLPGTCTLSAALGSFTATAEVVVE